MARICFALNLANKIPTADTANKLTDVWSNCEELAAWGEIRKRENTMAAIICIPPTPAIPIGNKEAIDKMDIVARMTSKGILLDKAILLKYKPKQDKRTHIIL